MSALHTPATLRIQARLERLELAHLREFAAEQAQLIEQLQVLLDETQRQLSYAEAAADHWNQQALDLYYSEAQRSGGHVGITQDCALVVVPAEVRP